MTETLPDLTPLEMAKACARRDRQIASESRSAYRAAAWAYRLQWIAPSTAARLLWWSEIKRDQALACHDEPMAAWVR